MKSKLQSNFIVIGEALNRLGQVSRELANRIPELRQVVDFRNQLTHGYHKIELEEVWEISVGDLPVLRQTVQSLLAELDRAANDLDNSDDNAATPADIPVPFRPPSPFDLS